MRVCCPWRSEVNVGSSGTGVKGDCESPCGYWESNPDLLEEQHVLLTDESSLQPLSMIFRGFVFTCFHRVYIKIK